MSWNEKGGTVSRSFDRWVWVESEIRAFHRLGLLWSEKGYADLWEHAEQRINEIFDPDVHYGDEHVGYFDTSVDGVWPDRFEWMIHAATIKDAVTAFEVYLEKALGEVLLRPRVQTVSGDRCRIELKVLNGQESPTWPTLKGFHRLIGNEVETARVREIRSFRHLLTHQRGELRSEAALRRFTDDNPAHENGTGSEADPTTRPYVGGDVRLTREQVTGILDDLARVIRSADHRVWAIAWGSESLSLPNIRKLLKKDYVTLQPDPEE